MQAGIVTSLVTLIGPGENLQGLKEEIDLHLLRLLLILLLNLGAYFQEVECGRIFTDQQIPEMRSQAINEKVAVKTVFQNFIEELE